MVYSAVVRLTLAICVFLTWPLAAHAQNAAPDDDGQANDPAGRPEWIDTTDTQPDTNTDWVRPSELESDLPVLNPQAVTVLRAEAFAIDLDSKSRVLRTLETLASQGRLNPGDQEAISLLAFLATESYDYQIRREGRVVNDFPSVRAEAVRLLGAVGGPAAADALQRVLHHEKDGYVLSRAVTAVAAVTTSPAPELLSTMTELVARMNAVRRPDNALAMAVVTSIGEMHDRAIRIDDPDLFRALISIAQGGYSNAVRREAVRVIDKLRQQTPQ